jgi:GntR family transcriptional regulator / MocR family aminotransferase
MKFSEVQPSRDLRVQTTNPGAPRSLHGRPRTVDDAPSVDIDHQIALRELPFALPTDGRPLQAAISDAIRSAMQVGRLPPGARLPSSRDLARQLRVARGTVVLAYEQLRGEGYLRAARGAGTSVVDSFPERWFAPDSPSTSAPRTNRGVALSKRGALLARSSFPYRLLPPARPFLPHYPAVDAFPSALWGRLIARHARDPRPDRLRGVDARGYEPLREAIAEHLRVHRGVECSGDAVLIVSGTQQILDLAARLLLDDGDAVWMEDPGHFGAREVLEGAGARLVPVPVDGFGIDVDEGIAKAPGARMAYVTPARQSPLGAALPVDRRLKLLDWARRNGAWIFEDDYDSEFRYEGRPLPALQGLDRHGTVLYSGTFSKTMFPGIRLAYAVLPDALLDPFAAALSTVTRFQPLLTQMALTDFLAEGDFARHLRRMRMLYAERREALLAALESELAGQIEIAGSSAGLELVARLRPGVNDRAVAKIAMGLDLVVVPLSKYAIQRPQRGGLVLGFAAVSSARSRRAVPALHAAIEQVRPR